MERITKAVIPIGGFGTRLLPITKAIPKEMLPIVDKPVIQYIIEELARSGIEDVYMVISKEKESIINYFSRNKRLENKLNDSNIETYNEVIDLTKIIKIHFILDKDQEGCAKAILKAKKYLKNESAFAIVLGDDLINNSTYPALKQLMDLYYETNHSVIGVHEVDLSDVYKYGIIDTNGIKEVNNVIEKPNINEAPSNLAILGRYIVKNDFLDLIKNIDIGVGGEYQISDVLNLLAEKRDLYYKKIDGNYYDIGSKEGYVNATVSYAKSSDVIDNTKLDFI